MFYWSRNSQILEYIYYLLLFLVIWYQKEWAIYLDVLVTQQKLNLSYFYNI